MNDSILISIPIFAYLMGSIPFGLIFTRLFTTVDIRSVGSGNIGATNVGRTASKTLGIITLFCDMAKGIVPVGFAAAASNAGGPMHEIYLSCVALFSFLGHLFPLYLGLKGGGKGVATAAGCMIVISPLAFIIAALVFILFVCMTSRVSVGSLTASAVLPLAMWKSTGSLIFTLLSSAIALMILLCHKDNIVRLIKGQEPPF